MPLAPVRPPSVVIIGRAFEVWGALPMVGSQRVSDHLNERRSMLILENVQLAGCEVFGVAADDIAINRADILLVIPVHETDGRNTVEGVGRVIPKSRHRVRMLVSDWVVEGYVHLIPEASVERFINSGHSEFLPVTDVKLSGPEGDRVETLVLVARRHLQLLIALPAPEEEAAVAANGAANLSDLI